jgi:hypothetical protein
MILYFKERRKEMKKNLFSFYIILTVVGLTIIFLFPGRGRAECDQREPFVACPGDPNTIIQPEVTAVENAVAGQPTLISPSGQTFDTTPTYTWTAVANATWYHLWINRGSGTFGEKWYTAAEVGCPAGTGNCSLTPGTEQPPGTYTWWVQAWYNAYGPWTDGKPFYVDPTGKNCQTIPAHNFTPYISDTTYANAGGGYRYRTAGFFVLNTAVNLPAGTQVTQVYVDYYDASTGDVSLWFSHFWPGGFSNFTQYVTYSSGTPGFGRLELNLIPANIIIDNAGHSYTVAVGLDATASSNSFINAIICRKPSP